MQLGELCLTAVIIMHIMLLQLHHQPIYQTATTLQAVVKYSFIKSNSPNTLYREHIQSLPCSQKIQAYLHLCMSNPFYRRLVQYNKNPIMFMLSFSWVSSTSEVVWLLWWWRKKRKGSLEWTTTTESARATNFVIFAAKQVFLYT